MSELNDIHRSPKVYMPVIAMAGSLMMLSMVSKGQNVKVCHRVIEDSSKTYVLTIDRADLNTHLAHGDYMGVCKKEGKNYFDIRIVPNPFFKKTDIKYMLNSPTDVQMIIYDQIGNKIATLVDEHQEAGSYSIEFNGSNISYAPGIHVLMFSRRSKEASSVVYRRLMEIH